MKIEIELNISNELQRKLRLYYLLYQEECASYLISITDKQRHQRNANEYLNKIIAIQSLLEKGCVL